MEKKKIAECGQWQSACCTMCKKDVIFAKTLIGAKQVQQGQKDVLILLLRINLITFQSKNSLIIVLFVDDLIRGNYKEKKNNECCKGNHLYKMRPSQCMCL